MRTEQNREMDFLTWLSETIKNQYYSNTEMVDLALERLSSNKYN